MSKEKISWKQKEQIIFICEILLFVIGSVLFLVSRVGNLFNLGLVAIMILFCMNILFSIKNFKENFLYFFMQLTLFTFQISRPFIGMCKGRKWWEESFQKEENIWFALTLIVITETALYIGANIIKFFHIKIRENNTRSSDNIFCKAEFVSNLRKVSMIVFYVTMLFYLIEQFEPLIKIGTGITQIIPVVCQVSFIHWPLLHVIVYVYFLLHYQKRKKRLFHWAYTSFPRFQVC